MAELQTTTLNRTWVLKTGIFMLVLLVFGFWGLVDGMYFYPKRGLADASFQLKNYLTAADRAGRLTDTTLKTEDPKASLAELSARESDLRAASGGETGDARKARMDLSKLEWLRSLNRAWRLNADDKFLGDSGKPADRRLYMDLRKGEGFSTTMSGGERTALSPQALLNDLTNYWNTTPQPSPLSAFDMVFQWIFVAVGLIGGLWILLVILKANAKKFTWAPETQRLTLPGGESMIPSDLEDVDKRLWHKYFVTLVMKGGTQHKLDLLRFVPLEDWVLEMEKTRFPERAAEAEREKAEKAAAEAAAKQADGNPIDADPNTQSE